MQQTYAQPSASTAERRLGGGLLFGVALLGLATLLVAAFVANSGVNEGPIAELTAQQDVSVQPDGSQVGVEPSWGELGKAPWGDSDQFEWEAATGLRPVPVGDQWGFMRTTDQDKLAMDDPFGAAPVYLLGVDGQLGTQIGVWTQAGSFDVETASVSGFDVRELVNQDQGPNYVYYLEHKGELTCEQTNELFPASPTPC